MIITAASLGAGDVFNALQASVSGDIVQMPAGSGYWTTTVPFTTNGVTLRGMGTGSTFIFTTSNLARLFQLQNTVTVRDFTINNSPYDSVFQVLGGSGYHITNINYRGDGISRPYFVNAGGNNVGYYGLIDNCLIDTAIPQFGNGSSELFYVRGPLNAWQLPSQCGTPNNLFIENCEFHGRGYVCDANSSSQVVVRNCRIYDGMKIDAHGIDSNSPPRSFRTLEAYNNTWYTAFTNNEGITIRGGAGYVFNNTCVNQDGTQLWFQLIDYGANAPWPVYGTTITGFSTSGASGVAVTAAPHLISGAWTVYISSGFGFLQLWNVAPSPSDPKTFYVTGLSSLNLQSPTVTGMNVTMTQTPVNWPTPDQIGVGQDPKIGGSQPFYLWNNKAATTVPGNPTGMWPLTWASVDPVGITLYRQQTNNPTASYSMGTMVSGGRDYFIQNIGTSFQGTGDIGYGTSAQMLAATPPTQVGVGWWATDTGTWYQNTGGGVLFTWNGSAWTQAYQPYTYPHPGTIPKIAVTASARGFRAGCNVVVH